jgi:hypothetical protein
MLLDDCVEVIGANLQSTDEQDHRHAPEYDCLGQNLLGRWRIQHVDCVLDSYEEVMEKIKSTVLQLYTLRGENENYYPVHWSHAQRPKHPVQKAARMPPTITRITDAAVDKEEVAVHLQM